MPRGSVKVFAPCWTELDASGNRVARQSPRFAYRFWLGAVRYQHGGYETKAKALAAGEARKAELRAGQEEDWRRYTLAALKDLSEAHQETNAEPTKRNHANSWDRLLGFFPSGMFVHRVDDVQLHKYLKHRRAKGFSDNSTRLDFAWLRKAMRLAHKKGLLPRVPDFPKLEYQRREQTFIPGELERVLSHLPTGYRLLFRAAEESGWRTRSELTTRRWTDVDFAGGWLHVDAEHTKAGKARRFPMTQVLRGILEEARAHVDRVQRSGKIVPWVFIRDDGQPIVSYRDAWQRALARAGFEKLPGKKGAWSSSRCVHDLRRGALRRWKAQGLDQDARMALAGHGDAATHALYLSEDQDEEALRAAARALDEKRGPVSNVVQLALFTRP